MLTGVPGPLRDSLTCLQSTSQPAQAAQQSHSAALESQQQLQGTAADLTEHLPAAETASANDEAAHLTRQLAAAQAAATSAQQAAAASMKALQGGSLNSTFDAAVTAGDAAQAQAHRQHVSSSLTEAVTLVSPAAKSAENLRQGLNTAMAQHATINSRLAQADSRHVDLIGRFDLAKSELTAAQAQVEWRNARLAAADTVAAEASSMELHLCSELREANSRADAANVECARRQQEFNESSSAASARLQQLQGELAAAKSHNVVRQWTSPMLLADTTAKLDKATQEVASQAAQLKSSRATLVSRDAEVANLQQQAAQLQQACQETEVSLPGRIAAICKPNLTKVQTQALPSCRLPCKTSMISVVQHLRFVSWFFCYNSNNNRLCLECSWLRCIPETFTGSEQRLKRSEQRLNVFVCGK